MNNSRVLLIMFFVFIMLIVIVAKLFTIQVVDNEKYTKIAKRQQNKSVKIKAERGVIKDRNGEILSFTKNDVSLFIDTRMTNKSEKEKIAKRFGKLFNKSEKHYLNILNSANKNICIEKKASKEKILLLSDLMINGYFQIEDYSRVYPYGSLASHILGFVDRNLDGVSGVEKHFDKYLTGVDGYKFIENDVQGRVVTINQENSIEPTPGNNIQLTIDRNCQRILEEELNKGLKKYKGESAVGIIMDPSTGEILALTNQPDYDPANYNLFSDQERRNRALTDTYEPGSTIKPLIMSMLLEEELTKESELTNTENGNYKVKGATIRDTHNFLKLTSTEIITHSSNVGIAKLSDKIDDDTFYRYLRNYGFGNLTSINLPGETPGFLKKPKQYSKISKNFIAFGYEISVTPIQLLNAYCALVNGGDLLQPYIIKSIKDEKENIVEEFSRNKIRSVISEKTSKRVIDMMKDVVVNGTGVEAQLPNMQVGGKTGTAQRLINNKYSSSDYNSSFVGFFPADNPKYIALIVVMSPSIGKYGGRVAAPIFHEIALRIADSDKNIINDNNKRTILNDAKITSNEIIDEKIFVSSNLEDEKTEVKVGNKESIISDGSTMPNLINLTKRDAIKMLNSLGIKYQVIGSGNVVFQSISAGTKLNGTTLCNLSCFTQNTNSKLRIN
ncbi:MAG: transpeptidase family protein [Bacteroidetes bacterium]|nr:transpeptidase family protein [Bacteroidota bacterium]MBU1116560.1 transpeptidase family protein [Bacteroidota bacterium]MBU1797550.1 transpeptidase family protein [Bacteroidota bacterium]